MLPFDTKSTFLRNNLQVVLFQKQALNGVFLHLLNNFLRMVEKLDLSIEKLTLSACRGLCHTMVYQRTVEGGVAEKIYY